MIKDYRILAVLTVVVSAIMIASVFRGTQNEYAAHQKKYFALAGVKDFKVGIVQLNAKTPDGVLIDRCMTCHIGVSNKKATKANGYELPICMHPKIVKAAAKEPHDFNQIGCVVCHDGNGRGLTQHDAHGKVHLWQNPLMTGEMVQANCSRCHDIDVKDLAGAPLLNQGKAMFIEHACWACHTIEGISAGKRGPNLSNAARFSAKYIEESILEPTKGLLSSKMPKFYWTDDKKIVKSLVVYLKAQRTSKLRSISKSPVELVAVHNDAVSKPMTKNPSAVIGEEIFNGHDVHGVVRGGCINCHSYHNAKGELVGGDVGPELTYAYRARGGEYIVGHIKDPTRDVLDSIMPTFDMLSAPEIKSLELFLKSMSFVPKAATGEDLFENYCASCHGSEMDGKGDLHKLLDPLPRNLNERFVTTYKPRLKGSIKNGVKGTAMPPWKKILTDKQIDEILSHIVATAKQRADGKPSQYRTLPLPKVGDVDRRTKEVIIPAAANRGEAHFMRHCTGCHGKLANGKGPLVYQDLKAGHHSSGRKGRFLPRNFTNKKFMAQETMTDERMYQSILSGVPGTPMPPFDGKLTDQAILDLIAYLRKLSSEEKK